jgi:hypothetical protein
LDAVDEDDATEEDANWTSKDDMPDARPVGLQPGGAKIAEEAKFSSS